MFRREPRQLSLYSAWLRAGRSGDRIPVGAKFSASFQTSPGAKPASYKMGTGSFPEVKSDRGVTPAPHSLPEAVVKNALATVSRVTSWYAQRQILCFIDRASL